MSERKLKLPYRHNKQSKGIALHYAKSQRTIKESLLKLHVYGTFDILTGRSGILSLSKRIQKEHPIDKGYFKTVYVLSDYGKRLWKSRNAT